MEFETLASQLLRAVRGRRSQVAWSRRLGYRSNVAYAWEAGSRSPTAAEALRAVELSGLELATGLPTFFKSGPPPWLADTPIASAAFVCALLRELRGSIPITELAARSGFSRYSISRWLSGKAEPRLPEFLAMIEACSLRGLDFVALIVDPASLPASASAWQELRALRRTAVELPWSHAVLRALELSEYSQQAKHCDDWVAAQLGLSGQKVRECLEVLSDAGLISWDRGRYRVQERTTDTGAQSDQQRRALKRFWAEVGTSRLGRGDAGLFSYNLFTVSRADLTRLQELHVNHFHAMRSLIADSTPAECVVVANLQLFELAASSCDADGAVVAQ